MQGWIPGPWTDAALREPPRHPFRPRMQVGEASQGFLGPTLMTMAQTNPSSTAGFQILCEGDIPLPVPECSASSRQIHVSEGSSLVILSGTSKRAPSLVWTPGLGIPALNSFLCP